MSESIIGIDLGTTNSAVAIVEDGVPVIIPVDGQPTMPSCVGLNAEDKFVVGQTALNQLVASPERTAISVKRLMGQDTQISLGDKTFSPEEISAVILGRLKEAAEAYLGRPVSQAVITVPAYFDEDQRKATRDAARLANLDVPRIINEPTAAALAYDAENSRNQKILVYDLGGGTFDVSVVVVEDGVVEVKASHGDTQLGGDDFDEELIKHAGARFEEEHGIKLGDDLKTHRRLKVALERAKCALSDQPFVQLQEDFIQENKHLTGEIERDVYEKLIATHLEKTLHCMRLAMKDATLVPNQLDQILLVGGSSRTPAVSALIESNFGISPRSEVNPDLIVAMGAAVQGSSLAGLESKSILVDITPHTFSTRILRMGMQGDYLACTPLIKRNTPLPCRKADVFFTASDYQEEVRIDVYQGESENPSQNLLIGDFIIQGLSSVPAGNAIVIEFALDLSGMLEVTATEKATGLSKNVVVDTSKQTRTFNLEEARENLAAVENDWGSFDAAGEDDDWDEKGADDEGIIELSNAKEEKEDHQKLLTDTKNLRKRAEALAASGIAEEDSSEIKDLIHQTAAAVKDQDWDRVNHLNQTLSDVLFYLED